MRIRLSQLRALRCFHLPSPLGVLPSAQAYSGVPGGPPKSRLKYYGIEKTPGPHWPCPLRGRAPGSIPRALSQGCKGRETRGATLPTFPMPLPPGKGLSQQHQRGRQLLAASAALWLRKPCVRGKGEGKGRQMGDGEQGLGTLEAYPPLCQHMLHATLTSPSAKGHSTHLTGGEAEARKGTGFARF